MIYLMSDIHGDYQSFYNMLVKINFSSVDHLYILGDAVDKGEDNLCLLDMIRKSSNIILIKGNHEYLFERYLQGIISAEFWDACGGKATRQEADQLMEKKKESYLEFLKSLPLYKMLNVKGKNYFLTHSGYNAEYVLQDPVTGVINIKESVDRAVLADQERYLVSSDIHNLSEEIRFDQRIIVGHFPTILLEGYGKATIYQDKNYIDIDTGNERRDKDGRLACLRLDDGREYYV